MAKIPNGIETLPKISIAWVGRMNVTDAGVTVVLKFLKFQNCPEITDCPEILGIW